jgi:hypothetical protein
VDAEHQTSRIVRFREKQSSGVGAIIHSAQIDPIYPGGMLSTFLDQSDKSGAMNDGPYTGLSSSMSCLYRIGAHKWYCLSLFVTLAVRSPFKKQVSAING